MHAQMMALRRTVSGFVCRQYSQNRSPFTKTWQALSGGIKKEDGLNLPIRNPEHADVVVIGGGVVGSSVSYWLKKRAGKGINVVVLEKDPTYSCASTVLSAGGMRQQFSLPENILLSQYSVDFLREVKTHLGPDVDVQFVPHGYLVLASENGAEELEKNVQLQRELGVKNELLTPEKLKARYPWMNTENIKLACIGSETEGWFDPWALLRGFKQKAVELGATFVKGEVVGFEFEGHRDMLMEGVKDGTYQKLYKVIYKTDDGEIHNIQFAMCVLAAGAQSGRLARMANIGTGPGLLNIPLPIEPRKRCVYCFESRDEKGPGLNTPMIMDMTGTWVRKEGLGNSFICGRSPSSDCDETCDNLDVDHEYFNTDIWPVLANRIPSFESLKVKSSWAGHYEYNTYDENGIIGAHPYFSNLFIASGFSGHGLQQSPAVGRAIAELILDAGFKTIDLTRFGFDRLFTDMPLLESNIY